MLTNVRWGFSLGQNQENGDTRHPLPNEMVAIASVSGEPVIFMSLGVLHATDSVQRASINRSRSNSTFYGDNNLSFMADPLRRDSSSPDDIVPGDKLTSNDSGALFGLLRGGTFLAKASALAQIIVSRMDDLVRIVSRNYEMFSDAMVHYSVNLRGSVYTHYGFFRTQQSSRRESPDYYEVLGNVEIGDEAKGFPLNTVVTGLTPTTLIKMQRIPAKDGLGDTIGTRWLSTYSLEGKRLETSSTASGEDYVKITTENQHWRLEVHSGIDPEYVTYIDVTPHLIQMKTDGGPEILLNGTTNTATVTATTVNVVCTDANVDASESVVVTADVSASVTSPDISMTGDVDITGNVTITGDVEVDAANTIKIGTLNLKTHVHNQTVLFGDTLGPT